MGRHDDMRSRITPLAAAALLGMASAAFADDYVWTGASGDAWGEAANWAPAGVPSAADSVTLSGNAHPDIDLGKIDRPVRLLSFGPDAAAAFTLRNGRIVLAADGRIVKRDAADACTHTIAADLSLSGDAAVLNDDGRNQPNHPPGKRRLVIKGAVSGKGTLRLGGSGTSGIELAGDNAAFAGPIEIDGGLVILSHRNALGDTAAGTTIRDAQLWFNSAASTAENCTIEGDAHWRAYGPHAQAGDITVKKGATWYIYNGGGHEMRLTGAISGEGDIHFVFANTHFLGDRSNTLTGRVIQAANNAAQPAHNVLHLSKTGGAIAIAGDLELHKRAVVQWHGDDQVADTSAITLRGGTLNPDGHSDTVGTLCLAGKANIDLPGQGNRLRFADSSKVTWSSGQLILRQWDDSDSVTVGASAAGLTADQLARVGFMNPDGHEPGLYRAAIESDGRLVPHERVDPINPPFGLAPQDVAARAALYKVDGRARLTGANTPLAAGTTITFFGDSITWLGGYFRRIDQAVQSGAGTAGKGITLRNRGINGAGVQEVLNGSATRTVDRKPQPPFADVLKADGTDIAVVYIGINDVRFLGTSPQDFEAGLRAIARATADHGTRLVLATPSVSYEKPDGSNPHDQRIEQFAEITRRVAAESGSTLVDLRAAYLAYLRNHNWELQVDGSLGFEPQGVLTNDGLHPNQDGENLLADLIAQGIYEAAAAAR